MNTPFMLAEPLAYKPAMSVGNGLYLLQRYFSFLCTGQTKRLTPLAGTA